MRIKEIVAEAGIAGALLKGAKALGPELEKISLPKFGASDLAKLAPAASKPIEKAVSNSAIRIPAEQFQRVSQSMQNIDQASTGVNYRNAISELGNVEMFLRQALVHNPEVNPALAAEVTQVATHANNIQRVLADVSAGKINAHQLSSQDIKAAVSNFSDKFTQLLQKLQ